MAESPSFVEMKRSMSLASLDESTKIREIIQADLSETPDKSNRACFVHLSKNSFVLPSLDNCAPDYRKFICDHLLDTPMLKELESEKVVNWSVSLQIRVPLRTKGDGNCLLHAASIALTGVHDRYHTLRKAVHTALSKDTGDFRIRWQGEEEIQRSREGLSVDEEEMDREWSKIIQLVSEEEYPNGPGGLQYGGSEGIHIFALANVLRRPLIVGCSSTFVGWGGQLMSPVLVGGIYLPLHWDPADCIRTPLFLGYGNSHFTAIVPIAEGNLDIPERANMPKINACAIPAIPLVKSDGSPLKIHFLKGRHERQNEDSLLMQYLDCNKVPEHPGVADDILVAGCKYEMIIPEVITMSQNYFEVLEKKFQSQRQEKMQLQIQHYNSSMPDELVKCTTPRCPRLGMLSMDKKCSECFPKHAQRARITPEPNPPYNPQYVRKVAHSGARNDPEPMETDPLPALPSRTPRLFPQPSAPVNASEQHLLAQQENRKCPTQGCKYTITTLGDKFCTRCKQSQQEYTSSVPCASQGCTYSGTKENHNLCSKCKEHFDSTLPGPPVSALPTSQCCNPECSQEAIVELVGRCPPCYIKALTEYLNSRLLSVTTKCNMEGCLNEKIPLQEFCKPCVNKLQKGFAANPVLASQEHQASSGAKSPLRVYIPPPSQNISTASPVSSAPICSTPNCTNLLEQGLGTLCSSCYHQREGGLQIMETQPMEPVTIKSGHGTVMIECKMKGCTCPGLVKYKALCEEHYKSITGQSTSSSEEPELIQCVYGNCRYFASAETNYLCSQHFFKAQEETFHAFPPMNQKVDETPCAIAGCYKKGRDDLNGLCLQCYEDGVNMELQQRHSLPSQGHQDADASGSVIASPSKKVAPKLPCVTSGCPGLVEPSEQVHGKCLRCQGAPDVIKRGNKACEPIYKYLGRGPRQEGADHRPLDQLQQPQNRPNLFAQQPTAAMPHPVNNPGSSQVINQPAHSGQEEPRSRVNQAGI